MKNLQETIDTYVAAWNLTDKQEIRNAFMRCLNPEIVYTDKNVGEVPGIDGLLAMVLGSYEKVPGRTFSLHGSLESFDIHGVYDWEIQIPGSGNFAGTDYVHFDEAGLMTRIIGFVPTL